MKNKSAEIIKLPSIDELLGVVNEEAAMDIEIRSIHSFEDHPFKVVDDEKMQELVESVRINGVLVPVLVRPDGRNGYEMVSGHRRMHASKLLGLETIPAIIRDMNRDGECHCKTVGRMEEKSGGKLMKFDYIYGKQADRIGL